MRGKSGQKSILNRFDIDPCNMTNTIRYRYDIDASGIEAEPGLEDLPSSKLYFWVTWKSREFRKVEADLAMGLGISIGYHFFSP